MMNRTMHTILNELIDQFGKDSHIYSIKFEDDGTWCIGVLSQKSGTIIATAWPDPDNTVTVDSAYAH